MTRRENITSTSPSFTFSLSPSFFCSLSLLLSLSPMLTFSTLSHTQTLLPLHIITTSKDRRERDTYTVLKRMSTFQKRRENVPNSLSLSSSWGSEWSLYIHNVPKNKNIQCLEINCLKRYCHSLGYLGLEPWKFPFFRVLLQDWSIQKIQWIHLVWRQDAYFCLTQALSEIGI